MMGYEDYGIESYFKITGIYFIILGIVLFYEAYSLNYSYRNVTVDLSKPQCQCDTCQRFIEEYQERHGGASND